MAEDNQRYMTQLALLRPTDYDRETGRTLISRTDQRLPICRESPEEALALLFPYFYVSDFLGQALWWHHDENSTVIQNLFPKRGAALGIHMVPYDESVKYTLQRTPINQFPYSRISNTRRESKTIRPSVIREEAEAIKRVFLALSSFNATKPYWATVSQIFLRGLERGVEDFTRKFYEDISKALSQRNRDSQP